MEMAMTCPSMCLLLLDLWGRGMELGKIIFNPQNASTYLIHSSLNDEDTLKYEFNTTWRDVWSIHCRLQGLYNETCIPCVGFNPPTNLENNDMTEVIVQIKEFANNVP